VPANIAAAYNRRRELVKNVPAGRDLHGKHEERRRETSDP
jgi:hypothetical protein